MAQLAFADAGNFQQRLGGMKRSVGLAIFYDLSGRGRADAGKSAQIFFRCRVDVDVLRFVVPLPVLRGCTLGGSLGRKRGGFDVDMRAVAYRRGEVDLRLIRVEAETPAASTS